MDILPQLVLNSIIAGATLFYYMRPILTTSRSIKLEVPAGAKRIRKQEVLLWCDLCVGGTRVFD